MIEINKSSQQLIKEANMRMVFSLIHNYKTISRADIKRITSLSPTTVSSLVEELIENGYVAECGIKNTKSSGRKAVMLKVNPEGGFFLGVDIQKKIVKADLYCLDFSLAKSVELPVVQGENLAFAVMRAISRLARKRKILGLTIGVPGVIDPRTNTLLSSTVLQVKDSKYIYQLLSEAMPDVQIFLKNSSGLIALAEKEFGAYRDVNNLIFVDIDDGVGAGVLIDGEIYDGRGMAGEFGHMSINYKGKPCSS